MPRPVSDSDSEPEENGLSTTQQFLNTQTTLRQRKSRSPAADAAEDEEAVVAGPSTASTLKGTAGTGDGGAEDEDEDEDEDEEDDEVYVVEKITGHAFGEEDVVLYNVKWKGYPSSENTWEPEENLEGARDMLELYFTRIGGHPKDVGLVAPAPKKRGRKSTAASGTPPPKKSKGEPTRASGRQKGAGKVDNDEDEVKWPDVKVNSDWVPPKPRKDAWEDILLQVETLQADDDGTKWAFVLWSVEDENGVKRSSKVLLPTVSIAAPQAMLRFYEKHLVFTKANQ